MKILTQLFQIILRRREPQDLDYDVSFAGIMFISMLGLSYVLNSQTPQYSQPLTYALVTTVTNAIAIYALLQFHGKQNRFAQTLSCLFGVALVLQLANLAISEVFALPLLVMVIAIWSFYLTVIILRSALECNTMLSVLFTIAYHLFIIGVLAAVCPSWTKELMVIIEESQPAVQSTTQ